ncbi:hypothetical protein PMCN06_1170 [Pasteurella multocida subsp. multocida str. HN06]|nr:hypothetical protein PMCN06_1170 [Pasteurella multocida subsp. multocida str. HN06]AFI46323.1 hypothetical protein NT08PM_1203 [Pasteurella multocida subsp. multocida str. 3480]
MIATNEFWESFQLFTTKLHLLPLLFKFIISSLNLQAI